MNLVPALGAVALSFPQLVFPFPLDHQRFDACHTSLSSLLYHSNAQVQQWDNPTSLDSQWIIQAHSRSQLAAGVVTLQNVASGKYLNVSGGKSNNGCNVQIWDNPSSTHSQWCVLEVLPGTFVLENLASGKVLNISGGKSANGTNAQQWDNPTSPHSHWRIH